MRFTRINNLVDGLKWNNEDDLAECYPCAIGKGKQNNPSASTRVFTRRGELVVTDIEGPIGVEAFGGFQYAVHFTDMYSRFSVVYFLRKKSDVGAAFQRYLNEHCAPLGIKVDCVQSDNAGEYIGAKSVFQKVCKRNKIATRSSSPYCH